VLAMRQPPGRPRRALTFRDVHGARGEVPAPARSGVPKLPGGGGDHAAMTWDVGRIFLVKAIDVRYPCLRRGSREDTDEGQGSLFSDRTGAGHCVDRSRDWPWKVVAGRAFTSRGCRGGPHTFRALPRAAAAITASHTDAAAPAPIERASRHGSSRCAADGVGAHG